LTPSLLPLLPPSGLDLSLLVAVLSGVLVLFALTEAFGWAFGGLVVPGYLASVLVVSPSAGVTVLAEAALTLAVVLLLSDGMALTGVWTRFFGRERFLLIVVISVLVRQASEVWLWPSLLTWAATRFDVAWIQPQDAHSVGLVLVPLTANAMGRGSLKMGLRQLFWPTAVTYVVLRELLLQHTNLSLGSMSLTYEDVALDFLQSARAYFVLLSGAFVATLFNGWFAWSSGGILIPALLGLAWYEPARIVATMAEAIILSGLYRGISLLPVIRHWNLEGARKLAILFGLAATLRTGLGWAHDVGIPVDQHALSGLGYIISSLIALKILQIGSAPTVLVPAFGTSLLAFVGGSAAAWAVEQVAPSRDGLADTSTGEVASRLLDTPEGVVEYARLRARLDPRRSPSPHLPSATLADWRRFWREVDGTISQADMALPTPPPGLRVDPGAGEVGGRSWFLVRETQEDLDSSEGWGVALLRPGAPGPAVVVEQPWHDPAAARSALGACIAADCAIVYFGGMELPTGRDDAGEGVIEAITRPIVHPAPTPEAAPVEPISSVALGDLAADHVNAPPVTWLAAAVDNEYIAEVVVPTLARWSHDEVDAAEVQRRAAPLGWSVAEDRACGPSPCLVLVPRAEGPLVAVRSGDAAPTLVEIPHPHRELGTLRIGLGAFQALGARVLVVDPSEPLLSIPVPQDPTHALHLGWRRALAGTDARTLIVRGLGAGMPGEARPTEPALIGGGRPIFDAPPPGLLPLTSTGTLGAVWPFRWAAAGDDERGLAGNHIAALQADLLLGGVTPAVLWFSETARGAWRGDERDAVTEWLAAAGLDVRVGSGSAPLEATTKATATERAALLPLEDLARRGAHQHNLNLLRKLVERAGTRVRAAWDPQRELAYIEVRSDHGAALTRAWIVPGDGRRVALPADSDEATIRSALGWMPADLALGEEP